MAAGIVGTDIRRKAAGALLAGWLLRGQPQARRPYFFLLSEVL